MTERHCEEPSSATKQSLQGRLLRSARNDATLAAFLLLLLLAILKPISMDIAFAVAFLYQIYIPMWFGYSPRLDRSVITLELFRVLWVSCLTFSVFALGYWAFMQSYPVSFTAVFPAGLLWSFAVNLCLIALPEEIFYRGFLQSRFGLRGILLVNLLFALGHFIGEYDPARLLPFFPGLVFSWFVYRSGGSLFGATLYHALCNVFAEWLSMSYTWTQS